VHNFGEEGRDPAEASADPAPGWDLK